MGKMKDHSPAKRWRSSSLLLVRATVTAISFAFSALPDRCNTRDHAACQSLCFALYHLKQAARHLQTSNKTEGKTK